MPKVTRLENETEAINHNKIVINTNIRRNNMTREEAIYEYAGILQDEFIRQISLIECEEKNLYKWILSKIKEKLLTNSATFNSNDAYMTGYDILIDNILDEENDKEQELEMRFVQHNSQDIFREAKRLIEQTSKK